MRVPTTPILCLLVGLAACGPGARYGSLRDQAQADLELARSRDAATRAPFEWTLASGYFTAADAAEHQGNWPAAIKWISSAKQFAAAAVQVTGGRGVQAIPVEAR